MKERILSNKYNSHEKNKKIKEENKGCYRWKRNFEEKKENVVNIIYI